MVPAATIQNASSASPVPAGPAKARHGFSFHELLSELNPLQYLPVIGTIYRAATGDTIPEAARMVGSSVVSFLTGGPVGVAINLGTTLAEKALGIDPERLGTRVLASLGIGHANPAQPDSAAPPRAIVAVQPWTPAQLASYGVERTASGDCRCGTLVGADVLNTLELKRLSLTA